MSAAAAPQFTTAVGQVAPQSSSACGVPAVLAASKNRVRSPRGVSTLMYACQQGDVERVRRLLRAQPTTIYKKDRTGKSALHYCCTSDNVCAAQAADVLVMAAQDLVESRDEDGFTPLHLAVIAGNMPLVTFLLANNADVNAVDSEKHTVVHWATVCGETGALRAVLSAGAPVSTPDIHGGYPLHYAAQMCGGEKDSSLGLQVLQALLQHSDIKINVEDGEGRQPLLWASSAGSAKAVLALIRAGATVDASDKDGLTALHCAASRGHTDCIDTLLTLCGMSPDVIDSNGCTALHYSVTLGHADATALLLAHGADPNRQDRKGRSPAHCGCAKGQFETVKLIGNNNANLWLRNARGDLPLHEAAASGRRELVRWLLEARPSQVNARNNDGRCPLHLAALNDNADMCKILLDAGAQVNPVLRTTKNIFMTPLDCALQRGFRSTAKYLQLHGGVPASRLSSSKMKIPNGTVPFPVREDHILRPDNTSTTDSERENGDKEDKLKRRHRRRLTHRYEKKKDSVTAASGDEDTKKIQSEEREKQRSHRNGNGKSNGNKKKTPKVERKNGHAKDNVTYSSEVKITNNYGGINIEKNGEIIIGSEGFPLIQGSSPVSATPKAKMDAKIRQISEDKDNIEEDLESDTGQAAQDIDETNLASSKVDISHAKSDTNNNDKPGINVEDHEKAAEEAGEHGGKQLSINIGDNIEEIKTLANTIEETAKSITKEVITIQQNLQEDMISKIRQMDQHSLLSNTSMEDSEHKELIVEAAVHEPPKDVAEVKVEEEIIEATETTNEESKPVEEAIINEEQTSKLDEASKEIATVEEAVQSVEVDQDKQGTDVKVDSEKSIGEITQEQSEEAANPEHETDIAIEKTENMIADATVEENGEITGEIIKDVDGNIVQEEEITKMDSQDDAEHGKNDELEPPQVDDAQSGIQAEETNAAGDEEAKAAEELTPVEDTQKDQDKNEESAKVTEEETKPREETPPSDVSATPHKEDTSDISVDTPDTVKLAERNVLEEQKTLSDADQKIESVEDEAKPPEIPVQEDSHVEKEENKEAVDEKKDAEEDIKEDSVAKENVVTEETEKTVSPKQEKESDGTEGVTAVSVASKTNKEQKRKFLKERKPKQVEEESPKEKIKRDRTPRGDGSNRNRNGSKVDKIKIEGKIREKAERNKTSARQEKNEKDDVAKKEKYREKQPPKKAIEKILEVTQNGTSPQVEEAQEKLRKRKKATTDERAAIKRKEKMAPSTGHDNNRKKAKSDDEESLSSSSESISRKKHKHRSFMVLEEGVEKRRVRIAKSKKKNGEIFPEDDEPRIKSKRSRIPISNLRRELSISDQHLDKELGDGQETRISLPNLSDERHYGNGITAIDVSDLSQRAPPPIRPSAYSDNDRSASDPDEEEVVATRSAARRRRLRKRMKRDSRSAGSDYESSNLIDSGFEPSPRSTRIPRWKNMSERGVCMTSVTQTIQSNIRRYHLERKIFQHLLELKRLQIRSGQHNEAVLVKRAIDDYHNSCAATVGAGKYVPEDFSFKSFEKFLYHSLRKLQKNGSEHLNGLPESPNPLLCTRSTHRCSHATHAYTGIPCAAYLPKMDHHTIPKIGYPCKPSGFLPQINTKKTVTLELCHGGDKQVISLPTDRLDQNKRYYVTFTVKGNDPPSPTRDEPTKETNTHRHAKSV